MDSSEANNSSVNSGGAKRKRSRWDAPGPEETSTSTGIDSNTTNVSVSAPSSSVDTAAPKPARKSKFSSFEDLPMICETAHVPTAAVPAVVAPSIPVLTPHEIVQHTMILKLQLQQTSEKLMTVVQDALAMENDPRRSPSPPPKYDGNGKRTNTREMRMRENLTKERTQIIEELMKLNPQFVPPVDFMRAKPFRRIYIPKVVNPLHNYVGLIIGPRGETQKDLEAKTGTKISIRGKGSHRGRTGVSAKYAVDEDEELHVHIEADMEERVAMAAGMIEKILATADDEDNEHRKKQLDKLRMIVGSDIHADEYCPDCGEKGHRLFECPFRVSRAKAAGVKCAICGDMSHPTRDCPMKDSEPTTGFQEAVIDNEYNSFLDALNGKTTGNCSTSSVGSSTGGASSSSSTVAAAAPRSMVMTAAEWAKMGTDTNPMTSTKINVRPGSTIVAPMFNLVGKNSSLAAGGSVAPIVDLLGRPTAGAANPAMPPSSNGYYNF